MPSEPVSAMRFVAGAPTPTQEYLTEESPLQIRLNGKAYSITMRTPGHDAQLALGLLFSEKQIDGHLNELEVTLGKGLSGDELIHFVDVKTTMPNSSNIATTSQNNRRLNSNSSCGLCGKIEWEKMPTGNLSDTSAVAFDLALLPGLFSAMRASQTDFEATGGSHAAAAFSYKGEMLSLYEDIGRHNAVDKVVGQLLLNRQTELLSLNASPSLEPITVSPTALCVSSRVAYEIVTKAQRAGFSVIAAVGAPSSLSVATCQASGITLIGFCRGERATVYTHPQRVL